MKYSHLKNILLINNYFRNFTKASQQNSNVIKKKLRSCVPALKRFVYVWILSLLLTNFSVAIPLLLSQLYIYFKKFFWMIWSNLIISCLVGARIVPPWRVETSKHGAIYQLCTTRIVGLLGPMLHFSNPESQFFTFQGGHFYGGLARAPRGRS